jgi:hypothetical protein
VQGIATLALKPSTLALASVVDAERSRLGTVGERHREVGQLRGRAAPSTASRCAPRRPHVPHTMLSLGPRLRDGFVVDRTVRTDQGERTLSEYQTFVSSLTVFPTAPYPRPDDHVSQSTVPR